MTSWLLPHLSSSLTDSQPSLNLLCHSRTDARFTQDARKAVWSIPYVSVTSFPSLKHNFIAYRSSKVSDFIFEIHQLWQSGFSRVYSNCFCSCSFEPEIIKVCQSSHKMYSNNILNFQESTTILNAYTKKVWKLIVCPSYIAKRKGGLITVIRNNTDNTTIYWTKMIRKQKWEEKQLEGRFKRQTNGISCEESWTWLRKLGLRRENKYLPSKQRHKN